MRAVSLGLALIACSISGCDRGVGAGEALAKARELEKMGLHTEAAQLLRSKAAGVRKSELGRLQLEVGRLYLLANVPDSALAAAEEAIRLGVTEPEVFYVEGESLRALMRPGADEKLTALLAKVPNHTNAKLSLARIKLRSSDPASALPLFDDYFKSVTASDPNYKVALLEHARALRNVGRHQEAADRYTLLLEDDPLEGAYYSGLAESLYRMKLRKEGRFVEEIYKLISQNSFEEHVEDRLRETGNTAFALGQRAINRTRQRRYLEAFNSYYQALDANQGDSRIPMFFADVAIQFRRFREARAALTDGLSSGMRPVSGLLWMLGRVSLEQEDAHGSFSAFEGAFKALAGEGDAGGQEKGQAPVFSLSLAFARSAIETADLAQARQALARAASLSPSSWENLYWQGRLELASGDAGKALALFVDASKRGGQGLMDLRYWSALALAARGQKDEALTQLQEVQQSAPGYLPAARDLVRLSEGNPSVSGPAGEALARLESLKAEVKKIERLIDSAPLPACGQHYLELGKLGLELKEPSAYDFLFLATDLLPQNAEACRLILTGMKQSRDIFSRLRLLRRLLDVAPGDTAAMRGLAEAYLKLHVRLDEAARLAEALHGAGASAASFRLRGQSAVLRGKRADGLEILRAGQAAYPQDADLRDALLEAEQSPADASQARSEH